MKSHGINAIPLPTPHPPLLDLADEIGLWVMLEETRRTASRGRGMDRQPLRRSTRRYLDH